MCITQQSRLFWSKIKSTRFSGASLLFMAAILLLAPLAQAQYRASLRGLVTDPRAPSCPAQQLRWSTPRPTRAR